ncbi:SDR family NAD(P)-dependent oxidoreductase [Mycoplasmoides alvi]|uniref:SDR family NAD(P)-dependent oxidoreductase n=1 Tax=Mycoplasmoides alvi TaxID=78580 RepID=UPI00051C9BE2|nr:SDR family NAD(P)-dependent oxidoreductase [Mycoplasmoides alvi]
MGLQTLIAVEDLLLEKEIKAILSKSKVKYENLISPETSEIDWVKFKQELRSESDEKEIILYIQPPKINYTSSLNLLLNDNLEIILKWFIRFNKIHQSIFQLTNNKKIKILNIISLPNDEQNLISRIINNYVWKYYEGMLMETINYGVNMGIIFRNQNESFWNHADALVRFFQTKNQWVYTNINKRILNQEIVSRSKVKYNKVIDWDYDKNKKVAIITGASGGIGLAIAKYLIQNHWKVYSLSRQGGVNYGIIYIKCDLKDENNIKSIINEIFAKEKAIHLIINNSGFGVGSSLENLDTDQFEDMYRINVMGGLKLINLALPFLNQTRGTIVNIGSMAGVFTIPFQVGYSLTKVLIDVYSEIILDQVNDKNIKIVNLMPGDTRSNFSKNRHLSVHDQNTRYKERIYKSIQKMEKDEHHGHKAELVAKCLYNNINKEILPIRFTIGKYKLLFKLSKMISPKMIFKKINKMYSQWENND